MSRLDTVKDEKKERNITYFCFAILAMFFICQLPHGIWLAQSGITLSVGKTEEDRVDGSLNRTEDQGISAGIFAAMMQLPMLYSISRIMKKNLEKVL